MNTRTVFISEREREHILKGLRTGLTEITHKYCSVDGPSTDLFVVLSKLGLLNKSLKNMERNDIMKYECLRKKMKEVRCNAKQLLQSDEISVEEMRTIIKNLNIISKKMKEMSKKIGTKRFVLDELSDSDSSDYSDISITKKSKKTEGPKKKIKYVPKNCNEKCKRMMCGAEVYNKHKVMSSTKSKKQKPNMNQSTIREESKCRSRTKLSDIFIDDCRTQSDLLNRPVAKERALAKERSVAKETIVTKERPVAKEKPVAKERLVAKEKPAPKKAVFQKSNVKETSETKYSKSNDHQRHSNERSVSETCSKCLCRRWSIPSVNRNCLKTYIKKNIKNSVHRNVTNCIRDCSHISCHRRIFKKKNEYVGLPGLVPQERKHLTDVRNRILSDPCNRSEDLSKNSSSGCCFNSNSDLEVFETSDTSLNKEWDQIFDKCSKEYKGDILPFRRRNVSTTSVGGSEQWDGERNGNEIWATLRKIKPDSAKEDSATSVCKCPTNEEFLKKLSDVKADKCIQSTSSKVNQCTSYDNFVLHPQFSWSMPMIGQAFRRSIPLAREKWRYFDKRGKFIRPSKPSADTGTTTRKLKDALVTDRSVQTNDMLFTKNMHQVMYLNVVYTKTHLRYIVPNSIQIPVLPQTPKVIERRAIDNGYAVTTYKADSDGVVHFTLAYSDGEEKSGDSGLTAEANRRLCQLKNLWISSARKFFSQLNEKLVGESGDGDENVGWTPSFNSSSTFLSSSSATRSESSTGSETRSDASVKTNDTEP